MAQKHKDNAPITRAAFENGVDAPCYPHKVKGNKSANYFKIGFESVIRFI